MNRASPHLTLVAAPALAATTESTLPTANVAAYLPAYSDDELNRLLRRGAAAVRLAQALAWLATVAAVLGSAVLLSHATPFLQVLTGANLLLAVSVATAIATAFCATFLGECFQESIALLTPREAAPSESHMAAPALAVQSAAAARKWQEVATEQDRRLCSFDLEHRAHLPTQELCTAHRAPLIVLPDAMQSRAQALALALVREN